MGSIQYSEAVGSIASFTTVCQSAAVYDWRQMCREGLLSLITARITDEGWQDRYYSAITGGGSFMLDHREPAEVELGGAVGNCGYTTFTQSDFEFCEIKVPNLELIRVGIEEHDKEYWERAYCKKFGLQSFKSPFVRAGSSLDLRIVPESEEHIRFAAWVYEQLYHAIGFHLFRTIFNGKKENVDEFDGFFELIANGNEAIGECNYPLSVPVIDFGFLVTGIPGAQVNPASRVPDDHPPVVLFPGTVKETIFPVAGKDLVDILTAWKRGVVTREWGYEIPAGAWALFTGVNQDECITRLAGCKMQCVEGGCGAVFMNPPQEVVNRAADYINNRYITLWPDTERIDLSSSHMLGERGWVYFAPRQVIDGANGAIDTWSLVMQNMAAQNDRLAQDWNFSPDDRYDYGLVLRPQGFQQLNPDHQEVITQYPDVTWGTTTTHTGAFCIGFAAEAKATLIMECPEVQLLIKGVACDIQPQRVCPDASEYTFIDLEAANANGTANVGFLSEIVVFADPVLPVRVGDVVFYRTAYGTSHEGVLTAYNAETGRMEINFEVAGINITIGGGPQSVAYVPNFNQVPERYIKTCSGTPAALALTFDYGAPFTGLVGQAVRVISALGSTIGIGTIDVVTATTATDTDITVGISTFISPVADPTDCNWDTLADASTLSLAQNGRIQIRLA